MRINTNNIAAFIRFIYKNKYGVSPSNEIIDSWTVLTNEEISKHLDAMYQSWQKTKIDQHLDIELFLKSNILDLPKVTPAESKVNPLNQVPSNKTTVKNTNIPPTLPKKKGNAKGVFMLIASLFVLLSGYIYYQYFQFQRLETLYTVTDNVTVRDKDGKVVGRMDLFPTGAAYSNLRAANNKIYDIQVDNKVSQSRQLLLPDANFWDYIMKRSDKIVYVNSNFLSNNEDYISMNTQVFKEINNVKNEKTTLTAVYRKVIVGSMILDPNLKNSYILNTCNYNAKDYTAIIKLPLKDKEQYTVIAKLNNGHFYKFTGNPDLNTFEAPSLLKIKHPSEDGYVDTDVDFLFKNIKGTIHMYNCDLSATDYIAMLDSNGDVIQFQLAYQAF